MNPIGEMPAATVGHVVSLADPGRPLGAVRWAAGQNFIADIGGSISWFVAPHRVLQHD